MGFLNNFGQNFPLPSPADSSITLFMVEIMIAMYTVLEKHKNMFTISTILTSL